MLEYVPEMINGSGVLTDPEVCIDEEDESEKKDEIKFESGIQSPEYLTPLIQKGQALEVPNLIIPQPR